VNLEQRCKTINARKWQEHVKTISAAWQKGVASIIETGQALIEAKNELEHGSFESMVALKLPFGPSTARRLMAIATHPIISNRSHANALPPSWDTLYALTKIPEADLKEGIEDETVNPKMQRKDVQKLLPPPLEAEIEDEDEDEDEKAYRREVNFRAFVNRAHQSVEDSKAKIQPISESEWREALDAATAAKAAWTRAVDRLRRENAELRRRLEATEPAAG
jgi:hypothetical protein